MRIPLRPITASINSRSDIHDLPRQHTEGAFSRFGPLERHEQELASCWKFGLRLWLHQRSIKEEKEQPYRIGHSLRYCEWADPICDLTSLEGLSLTNRTQLKSLSGEHTSSLKTPARLRRITPKYTWARRTNKLPLHWICFTRHLTHPTPFRSEWQAPVTIPGSISKKIRTKNGTMHRCLVN